MPTPADGVVVGLINSATGRCEWNPEPDGIVEPGDEVMQLRPGPFDPRDYPPLSQPPAVLVGECQGAAAGGASWHRGCGC